MDFNQFELAKIFEGTAEIVARFHEEQNQAIVAEAFEKVKDVAAKVAEICTITQDAAEDLTAALLMLGGIVFPALKDNEGGVGVGVGSRGAMQPMVEVSQLEELYRLFRQENKI